MNVTAAYAVQDASQVGEARRAAIMLAERLSFSEARSGQVALVVAELATNLAKYARRGEILLRPIRRDEVESDPDGIEILAIDAGPGLPDVALSRQDGYSTAGTLGHGLGAIERQADVVQIYTQPSGTIVLARLWRERAGVPGARSVRAGVEADVPGARQPPVEIAAIQVSYPGEEICGDDWDWRLRDERLSIIVADGLGHGLSAHEAARQAITVYRRAHEQTPHRVIEDIHAALRVTRGAAVAMIAIDLERGVARYSGIGNTSASVVLPTGARQSLISQNGTAGHTAPRIQEHNYPIPAQSILVMHSDGLSTHWDLAAYPGLRTRHPSVIGAVLYRDFSRRRDDVTVVVAKSRTAGFV
jgi:anti-sigma regulatory factor (Ser/Thr protein kinase)